MKLFTPVLAVALAVLSPAFVVAAPAPLVIDPTQSRVEVVVQATVDSFVGKLDAYQADITVDAGRVTAATFNFSFADVHTGKTDRDDAMDAWEDTKLHPKGAFVLRSLEPVGGGRFNAHGTLTLHDVAIELTFPVSVTNDQKLYSIDGEAPLDTRTFDLPIIRKFGFLKVDPLVKVRFHLQGVVNAPAVAPTPAAAAPAP